MSILITIIITFIIGIDNKYISHWNVIFSLIFVLWEHAWLMILRWVEVRGMRQID